MTPGAARAARLLAEHGPLTPRDLARLLWPDSPAWERRTRRYGANRNGAVGGTMPMNAAKLIHRLEDDALAEPADQDGRRWRLTDAGHQQLEGTDR